jgi:predicted CopG family antitoxin
MADRPEVKTYSIPRQQQHRLRVIARLEHRSMSGVISALIDKRWQELDIAVDEHEQSEMDAIHA